MYVFPLGIEANAPHAVMTTFLQKHLVRQDDGTKAALPADFFSFFFLFLDAVPVFRYSSSSFPILIPLSHPTSLFVYSSVWTSSPGGDCGSRSTVRSNCHGGVWCGDGAWLGRRWGKTSCPRSLLCLSHLFSVSLCESFSSFLFDSLHDYTEWWQPCTAH